MSNDWNQPSVGNIMNGLLGDIQTALANVNRKVQYAALIPGAQAADDLCNCGQLSMWCASSYRTRNFPDDAGGVVTNCEDTQQVFDCRVRIVRCVPGWSADDQSPPTASSLTQATLIQEEDRWIIWNTLACALRDLESTYLIANQNIYTQSPVGPLGQCAGSETSFRFALIPQCCPVDPTLT